MPARPVLALTMGDPAGVGPELAVLACQDTRVRRACRPLLVGSREVFRRAGWRGPVADPGLPCPTRLGRPSAEGGRASYTAVMHALSLAARGAVRGIVTGPVSKEAWRSAGVRWLDHTDLLKAETGSRRVAMMLLAGSLRTVLATRHLPLKDVPRCLTASGVAEAAELAREALRELGFKRPRIGICALNPHAGEGGLLGKEERTVLIRAARRLGRRVVGVLPADSAWAEHGLGRLDALVTLYHDQALIPLKTVSPYGVVNWTLGLPLVRTSPGHGTAFDIAGKGRADKTATVEALLLAARLAVRRN